jgi:hypothetical protein
VRQYEVKRSPVVVDRMRRVAGATQRADPGDEVIGPDCSQLPSAEDREHVPPKRELVALIGSGRHLGGVATSALFGKPLDREIAEPAAGRADRRRRRALDTGAELGRAAVWRPSG